MNVVLLPGLDGTGRLFARFVAAAPTLSMSEVALPPDRVLSYDQLADYVQPLLPQGKVVLVAESFSGPLALRLAPRVQPAAIVLCASYIRAPFPHRLSAASLSLLLRARPRVSVVKALLSGGDAAIAADLLEAVATVTPDVIASRLRMVLEVDARGDLSAFLGRLLYLRATRDRLVPRRQAELVVQAMPGARVAHVDGPHLLLQARPRECWNEISVVVKALRQDLT